MARTRVRINLSVDSEVHRTLSRVGNQSQYIDILIERGAREWTEALALLLDHGWDSACLLAACDALAGYGRSGSARGGAFIAEELEQAEERERVFADRQIPASKRQRCLKQVAEIPSVAHALSTLVREYYTGNDACREAVRRQRRAR